MKFLCLILWPGVVCTDTNDADTDDALLHKALWLVNQMSRKGDNDSGEKLRPITEKEIEVNFDVLFIRYIVSW